jgi:hypothetical protein
VVVGRERERERERERKERERNKDREEKRRGRKRKRKRKRRQSVACSHRLLWQNEGGASKRKKNLTWQEILRILVVILHRMLR